MTDDETPMSDAMDEAFDWFTRIEEAPDDASLRLELERWRARSEEHRRAYASVARMLKVAKALPAGHVTASGRLPRARVARWPFVRPTLLLAHPLLAAGGLALLAGLCVALFGAYRAPAGPGTLYETVVAETQEVALDDGSLLFLDAETRVRVTMAQRTRTVELLGGQAYFDVAPDSERPFVVEVAELTVTVTGTQFAVSRRGNRIAVAVESGSVEAAHHAEPSTLSAGDRVSLNRITQAVETATVDPSSVGTFRAGRVLVENVSLGELIEQLDAHYDGDIWLGTPALADAPVSGSFDLAEPVVALRAAAGSQNATVRRMSADVLAVVAR